MLTKAWGGPAYFGGRLGELDQRADLLHLANPRVIDLYHAAFVDDLGVVNGLLGSQVRFSADIIFLELRNPFIRGLLLHALNDDPPQSNTILLLRKGEWRSLEPRIFIEPL